MRKRQISMSAMIKQMAAFSLFICILDMASVKSEPTAADKKADKWYPRIEWRKRDVEGPPGHFSGSFQCMDGEVVAGNANYFIQKQANGGKKYVASVGMMMVRPQYQALGGVGTALMRFFENVLANHAVAKDICKVTLKVEDGEFNQRAIHLYEKFDYVKDEEETKKEDAKGRPFVKDRFYDNYCMMKSLEQSGGGGGVSCSVM